MKIVVAPDSFKGSLTAVNAAGAMARGILRAGKGVEIVQLPVADGGEGTLEAILTATGGQRIDATVCGPLGENVTAAYGLLPGGQTAIIEMAQAAGLHLVPPNKRDPRFTSTYGVGELILRALNQGADKIVVAIGGSATNDGGAGAMQALGARFIDSESRDITTPIRGIDLARIAAIDLTSFRFDPRVISVTVASDVTNPLVGPNGASAVYGPQKGATPTIVEELDAALAKFAAVVRRDLGISISERAGAGAAGGLGGGLVAFLGAELKSGIDLVLDTIGFDEKASGADYGFTGEGRIDMQTLSGKVIAGVLARCNALKIPVVAFGGAVELDSEDALTNAGLIAAVPIVNRTMSLDEAIDAADTLLCSASYRVSRLIMHSCI